MSLNRIMYRIPFNIPHYTGNETKYLLEAAETGKISGNGLFTQKCHAFFENQLGYPKVLLTTSCTDALEMAAILCKIEPEDEVIVPSFTFVSTANAFILRGAKIVFVDSGKLNPNLDVNQLEKLITPKTKAIVVVHYAGVACDMDHIMTLAQKYGLLVIEDAAHSIDAFYKGRKLGTIGHLAAFSFHETKNIMSGEGGMLVINDKRFEQRAEIIWEKGTNRAAFQRGEVDKYNWQDVGSSFLPSELTAAVLFAQLEKLNDIQQKRIHIWNLYRKSLSNLETKGFIRLPHIPEHASNNGHLYYLICKSQQERDALIKYLAAHGIQAVFHYLPLHKSDFYLSVNSEHDLPNAEFFSQRIVRLPLFYSITDEMIAEVCDRVRSFFSR